MRLNSLYDPDFTGVGHQPYGYDQLTPLYRRYMVTHVGFEVTLTNPSADGIVLGAMLQASSGTATLTGANVDTVMERPQCVVKFINNTGSQVAVIKQPMLPLCNLEGLTSSQWNDQMSIYGALVTANPTLSPYLRVAIGSASAGTGDTAQIAIKLVFRAKFYERIVQNQS